VSDYLGNVSGTMFIVPIHLEQGPALEARERASGAKNLMLNIVGKRGNGVCKLAWPGRRS
jgi:hypothetical protein